MRFSLVVLLTMSLVSCDLNSSGEEWGETIPFRTFLASQVLFHGTDTRFVVLRNESEEAAFQGSIKTGGWAFPTFSYGDSMLVGIVYSGCNSSDRYQIDSLKVISKQVAVFSTLSLAPAHVNDYITPSSFVAIKMQALPFRMEEVRIVHLPRRQ